MINCTINGKKRSIDISPVATLRDMLLLNGNFAVRDSDDAEGFCGSDTVLLDGTPVFSNLVLAGEAEDRGAQQNQGESHCCSSPPRASSSSARVSPSSCRNPKVARSTPR